jgi:UDP-GlcNAc:undecaprenyl-phosphate/decaprenyl-phosphate GlcNAc-1-phosphate transferase
MFFQLTSTTLLAILLSVIAAPISISLAWRFRMIDKPGSEAHKIHKSLMPRAGGIIIFFVMVLGSVLSGTLKSDLVTPIIFASVIILVFGVWDDIHGILAPWKLLGQVLATLLLIWQGVFVRFPGNFAFDIFLTFFWVIGITNAFNLVDSMDGLAVGLGGITAAFLMLGAFHSGQVSLALFGAVLLGCCIGVFFFNFSLSRLFLGDSGSQLLGFSLASLALIYNPPQLPQASSWFVPILLFSIPIFDTSLVTISRLRRKLPIYKASRDHTYHRLVVLGIPPLRAVFTVHLAAVVIDLMAFMALFLAPVWANIIFFGILLAGLVSIIWLDTRKLLRQSF